MPPWPEWQFEYIGSRFLGKLLGMWTGLWVSFVRKLFRLFTRERSGFAGHNSNRSYITRDGRPWETGFSLIKRFSKIAVSTVLTLAVWRLATLTTVWSAVGNSGHRVLAAVLLLVSAVWVVSLIWICLSKSGRRKVSIARGPSIKPRSMRSNRARTS